jgi:hypothetical protein
MSAAELNGSEASRRERSASFLHESESKYVGDDVSRPPVSHRQKRGFDWRLWQ